MENNKGTFRLLLEMLILIWIIVGDLVFTVILWIKLSEIGDGLLNASICFLFSAWCFLYYSKK